MLSTSPFLAFVPLKVSVSHVTFLPPSRAPSSPLCSVLMISVRPQGSGCLETAGVLLQCCFNAVFIYVWKCVYTDFLHDSLEFYYFAVDVYVPRLESDAPFRFVALGLQRFFFFYS